jgi:hypothetical protein
LTRNGYLKRNINRTEGNRPFLGGTAILRPPYGLPAGYFEDFAEILMYRIHIDAAQIPMPDAVQETAEISPLLAELQKTNPYRFRKGISKRGKQKFQPPKTTDQNW